MTSDDLMRLRELRDNLEWYEQYAAAPKRPWTNYRVQIRTTRSLVESSIRRLK